ncbi:MAG TPA: PASTA domain-containing protein [Armatimonadota bacterium]|nr:PASTA domain-containing protein [Armatimonadota bacterium]
MSNRGLGREEVHESAWGRVWYPHPLVSCMMPLIAILAMMVIGMVGFSLWEKSLPGNTTVPAVVGLPLELAERKLLQAGLEVDVEDDRQTSEKIASGSVISISPDVGRSVKEGRIIHLIVSAGSAFSKIPNVVNVPQQEAHTMIEKAGLLVAHEKYIFDDDIPIDRIIKITPRAGTKVARNSSVDLVISRGPKDDEDLGVDMSGVNPDTDLRSSVLTVDIPQDEKAPADVRIDVTDSDGKRTVYNETHNPGDTVVYTVQGIGPTTAEVYFGNRLILTRQL